MILNSHQVRDQFFLCFDALAVLVIDSFYLRFLSLRKKTTSNE